MSHRFTLICAVALACLIPLSHLDAQKAATRAALPPALDSVRVSLERYQDPLAAVHDGYLSTVACIDFPTAGHAGQTAHPAGAMGVHFLNMGNIGPQPNPARPPVLIYEPRGDTLRLVAAEWFVPTQLSKERPQLFGRQFDGPMAGHEPIMPAALEHWDLHVWLWKDNPAGVYAPTNPALKCPPSVYTVAVREEQHAH
jgi:hypothetical protein